MICPHCGNQTNNISQCDHCGSSTEFAKRTNYLSVGTSANGRKLLPDFAVIAPSKKSRPSLTPWLCGAIAFVMLLCIAEGVILSLVLGKLTELNGQIESSKYIDAESNTYDGSTTEDVLDIIDETDNVIPISTVADIEEDGVQKDNIIIQFDMNPTDHMESYDCTPVQLKPQSVDQEIPPLSDISEDAYGYTWIFTGWNTKPDGTGVFLRVGQCIELPLSESITLYAQWDEQSPNKHPVE